MVVGQSLGMADKKFKKLIEQAPQTKKACLSQKYDVGLKIHYEIIDQELQDLNQMMSALKAIEKFLKQREKVEQSLI